jgi:tetratricopeptide (TPR) repeat protein
MRIRQSRFAIKTLALLATLQVIRSVETLFLTSEFDNQNDKILTQMLIDTKMDLWSRGGFALESVSNLGEMYYNDLAKKHGYTEAIRQLKMDANWSRLKLGPVLTRRREFVQDYSCMELECPQFESGENLENILRMRGGDIQNRQGNDYQERLEAKLQALGVQYGPDFTAAIEKNKEEHEYDCEVSCQSFYCASASTKSEEWTPSKNINGTTFTSYSFGATPPEDFSEAFGFPLDLIKVTEGKPLFSNVEAKRVVQIAKDEGIEQNEFQSGKYKLAGDWLLELPNTREWFNERLKSTFFPLLAFLFPEIVSSPSVLRAHSVSLLKYNSSHPRTDVHIDNGILAMTLAMTPSNDYVGGGTFFEHMGSNDILSMDVGHGTFRPGSVRHGGHKVSGGERFILGAFLLIQDRVEHVRRLKNRGSELRKLNDLQGAARHFEWALAINPKCTTCLKDWAEILLTEKNYDQAEKKIRLALDLLEDRDSDALFSLGVILSEAGKDEESIAAYLKSVSLNADDTELCYNLGIKLGARGDVEAEIQMYGKATSIDPTFGGAWLNWGTVLAEQGKIDEATDKFLKGLNCPEVKAKSMMNLALVYEKKANAFAAGGNLIEAKSRIEDAATFLEASKAILEKGTSAEDAKYLSQYDPLRLQCHRLLGSIFAGLKQFEESEEEFRNATKNFPDVRGAWEMLARILDVSGKPNEAREVREKIQSLFN